MPQAQPSVLISILCGALMLLLAGCAPPGVAPTVAVARPLSPSAGMSRQQRPIGNRHEFSAGACIAFRPAGRPIATILIDPGHGGPDSGAMTVVNGEPLAEATVTLGIGTILSRLLVRAGYRVVLTRTRDESVVRLRPAYLNGNLFTPLGDRADLQARVDCANAAHALLLVAVHLDSFDDPSVGGSETIYDAARPFSPDSRRLASILQESIVSTATAAGLPVPDRGIETDDQVGTPALTLQGAAYGHLIELGPAEPGWVPRPSAMPGALVEPLFLSNPYEAAFAASRHGQAILARSVAAGIERYLRP